MEKPTTKYKHCNHHHEIEGRHQLVDFGTGEFVANNEAIPLLNALHQVGLKTRTHHIETGSHCFLSILMDGVSFEQKNIFEKDATRTKFNGMKEVLISWKFENVIDDVTNNNA